MLVSTHSHPKVAASLSSLLTASYASFNTQPPEGGCFFLRVGDFNITLFQHTATRRWLRLNKLIQKISQAFQHTATRRWLPMLGVVRQVDGLFQHTATRRWLLLTFGLGTTDAVVSTHSHPKVAAQSPLPPLHRHAVSTHSHPKVAACFCRV